MEESGYVEITLERVLAVWWAFVWRSTAFSMLVGAFIGMVGGGIMGAAGHAELSGATGAILGWIASIPVSMFVLRQLLMKRFSDFSIRLVPVLVEPSPESSTR